MNTKLEQIKFVENRHAGVYSKEQIAELNELSRADFDAYLNFTKEIETAGIKANNQAIFDYVHSESIRRLA